MEDQEKSAKQAVLKGIVSFMGKLNSDKLKPKKEEPKEEKKDDEVTLEMIEKLKSIHSTSKKDGED